MQLSPALGIENALFTRMRQSGKMLWKAAARAALHYTGGLAALRFRNRRKFRVLTFHSFADANQANVEAICSHVAAHFEPVSLAATVDALQNGGTLPDNALAITVDDGYRNYLLHGHPIFRRHRLPVTLYAVSGFAAGRLWLWPDQIEFGLEHTSRSSIRVEIEGREPTEFTLTPGQEKTHSIANLTEALKLVPNPQRLTFMTEFGRLCRVEIPAVPPTRYAAMSWDELRAVAAEGVEIGCHTESHPILTRLESQLELEREVKGAKQSLEQGIRLPVRHFCYPNGKASDFDDQVVNCVRDAGFESATTCVWGLNARTAEPLRIQRLPFDAAIDYSYAVELLAGLHV
jgi:peptidoglycan/xylan/chitin deacetylase (PgdA/CDA1 family)